MRFKSLQPSPLSLVESLRDIGYSMETALADVIDNSVTAKASLINISFAWNNASPWLAVEDNGIGMSYAELLNAMKLGSTNPLEKRNKDDLGRFGLGLKTASFSQCRKLTVITKKESIISSMEWDLDQITEDATSGWKINILSNNDILLISEIDSLLGSLKKNETGTIVLWRMLDRLDNFDSLITRERKLNILVDASRKHIELTFHRFLNAGKGRKSIGITLNNDPLEGRDPFNSFHNATVELPKQAIFVDNQEVSIQPYILPHYSKVSLEEYEKFSGEGGYLHNQGFYVYRNKRLIIKSTWFRLIRKEELTKLIRVLVDIPNTLDHVWKIDVKKSNASPPEVVKKQLRQIISEIEYSGKRVFKQKGHKLQTRINEPFWNRRVVSGKVIYEISKKHPIMEAFQEKLSKSSRIDFINVIKSIESTFPADLYFNDFANSPELVEKPKMSEKELTVLIQGFLPLLVSINGNKEDAINELLKIDPFASFSELTASILNKMDI